MFTNINRAGYNLLANLVTNPVTDEKTGGVRDLEIGELVNFLGSKKGMRMAFEKLAGSDGVVTIDDLQNYQGDAADEVRSFLNTALDEFQFGVGGEKMANIPALSWSQTLLNGRPAPPGSLKAKAIGSALVNSSRQAGILVLLGDGSVRGRPSSGFRGAGWTMELLPYLEQDNLFRGDFSFTDDRGNSLRGFHISRIEEFSTRRGSGQRLHSVIVAPTGIGTFTAGVGVGESLLNFTKGLLDPVSGELKINAPK